MIKTDQPEVCAGTLDCIYEQAQTKHSDAHTYVVIYYLTSSKCTEG